MFHMADNCNVGSDTLTCFAVSGGMFLPDVQRKWIAVISILDPGGLVILREMGGFE